MTLFLIADCSETLHCARIRKKRLHAPATLLYRKTNRGGARERERERERESEKEK